METCKAQLLNDNLRIENDRIARVYRWNQGHLIALAIEDKRTGRRWNLDAREPDFAMLPEHPAPADGDMQVLPTCATAATPEHLRVQVTTRLGSLWVRRVFRLYDGSPAIGCDFYVKGSTTAAAVESSKAADLANIESAKAARQGQGFDVRMERLGGLSPHLRVTCARFYDVTDRRNNLVETHAIFPYRHPSRLSGNVLFIDELLSDHALFIVKEAPCSDVQLAGDGTDFLAKVGELTAVGLGVGAGDIPPDEWVRCYGLATGVADGGPLGRLRALREYQRHLRIRKPGRDHMIMLNTWGDRGQDRRVGEAFALAEIEAAARLGVTHFQLDDGWQSGQSSNSAFAGGSLEGIWNRDDYWTPHPQKFPNGLEPVVAKAREAGIELCLWFNPSKDDSNANWAKDADALIGLYRRYGVRTFKIDGVMIADKKADVNFRAMLDRVMAATHNEATFNLDVTAGRRFGYHYLTEYGTLFLENRYTDWSNYYPHWTLRNLWHLSRYVPTQNLQIEFLNRWRNADKYPADDPLAPQRVPFEYCFAVTMAAQPLAWFEASNLPPEAFEIAPAVQKYRRHQAALHGGTVLPIGDEPSGASWTGLQSMTGPGEGYFLVYREYTDRTHATLPVWDLAGKAIRCASIVGQGRDFDAVVGENGEVTFRLPERFSYALYRYETV